MMDIKKLIKQLRTESLYKDKATLEIMDLCQDAANALSALKAGNEKLRDELERELSVRKRQADFLDELRGQKYIQISTIGQLRSELEQIKQERDSLRCFYESVVATPDCNTCQNKDCIYRPKPGEITRFNCPLWHGQED